MRFFLLMAFYGVAAIVVETMILAGWPAQMLRFDLVLPAVAMLAFYHERRQAAPVLVFYGALMDVASGAPFGMSILSYVVIYAFVRTIIAKISFQEGVGLLFWVAIMSLTDKVVSAIVMMVSTGGTSMAGVMLERAPAQALLDAAVGLVMVPLLVRYGNLTWENIRRPKGLQWG